MARSLVCALALLLAAAAPASATQFRVGGQKGWSVPGAGSEPYNAWAGRLRFQIGDQLLFVYPKETDSVLLVDAAAYNACNASSPVARFDDGSTVFTFDRSGPFFFISGNEASCRANEKLIVVVLADRSGTRTPPAMTPPPSSAPPAPSPTSSPPVPSPSTQPSPGAAPLPAPAATPTSSPPPSTGALVPAPAPTTIPSSPPALAPAATPTSPPAPAGQVPPPSGTPGGVPQPPSGSANAPGAGGTGSTTPPPPSASDQIAAAHVVAGFVGSLAGFVGYAMLAA